LSGAIGHRLQPHAGRQLCFHLRNRFQQAVDDGDGVFILRFLDAEQERALAVVQRQRVDFLGTVYDPGELLHAHRGPVFARHDDPAKILRPLHAGFDLHHALLLARADRTDRQVLVFIAHGGGHLPGRDAKSFQCLGIEVDVDFALGAAHHGHRPHAAHVFQALSECLVGPVGQLDGRNRSG